MNPTRVLIAGAAGRDFPRFQRALVSTVSLVPDASHSLLVDAGPPLADEIADWLEEGATLRSRR